MRKYFLLISLWIATLFGGVIDDGLVGIPLHDKLLMKQFAELNLRLHQASHVIYFDNKPASLAVAWGKSPQRRFTDVMWIRGLRAFKKHESLFPHPNFIFNLEVDEDSDGWQPISLFIINKRALQKCLAEHLPIFQEALGGDFNTEQFILQLESGRGLTSLIEKNEMLLGLLLGFGAESSGLYQEMRTAYKGEVPPHSNEYCPQEVKSPNLRKLFPVGFMGNPNSPAASLCKYELFYLV